MSDRGARSLWIFYSECNRNLIHTHYKPSVRRHESKQEGRQYSKKKKKAGSELVSSLRTALGRWWSQTAFAPRRTMSQQGPRPLAPRGLWRPARGIVIAYHDMTTYLKRTATQIARGKGATCSSKDEPPSIVQNLQSCAQISPSDFALWAWDFHVLKKHTNIDPAIDINSESHPLGLCSPSTRPWMEKARISGLQARICLRRSIGFLHAM